MKSCEFFIFMTKFVFQFLNVFPFFDILRFIFMIYSLQYSTVARILQRSTSPRIVRYCRLPNLEMATKSRLLTITEAASLFEIDAMPHYNNTTTVSPPNKTVNPPTHSSAPPSPASPGSRLTGQSETYRSPVKQSHHQPLSTLAMSPEYHAELRRLQHHLTRKSTTKPAGSFTTDLNMTTLSETSISDIGMGVGQGDLYERFGNAGLNGSDSFPANSNHHTGGFYVAPGNTSSSSSLGSLSTHEGTASVWRVIK